jgi:hypothetical protein
LKLELLLDLLTYRTLQNAVFCGASIVKVGFATKKKAYEGLGRKGCLVLPGWLAMPFTTRRAMKIKY